MFPIHPLVLTGYYLAETVFRAYDESLTVDSLAPQRRLQAGAEGKDNDVIIHELANPDVILGFAFVEGLMFVALTLVVACVYSSRVTSKRDEIASGWVVPNSYSLVDKDFKYGICSCFDSCTYCLYGCCCTGVRMSDTFAAMKVEKYWIVVLAVNIFFVLGQILKLIVSMVLLSQTDVLPQTQRSVVQEAGHLFLFITGAVLAYWLAGKRTALRQRFGDKDNHFVWDFFCYWCCGPCTVIQDARQVDGATNTRVDCCCKLVYTDERKVSVGAPIQVVEA